MKRAFLKGDQVVNAEGHKGHVKECEPHKRGDKIMSYDVQVRWDDGGMTWVDSGELQLLTAGDQH